MREAETALRFTDPEAGNIILMPETAASLQGSVEQMGIYLTQMAQMMAVMQQKLAELEQNQNAVTIRHGEVKNINQLIRIRAAEYCEKYELNGPQDEKAIRAAIRKAVLTRYQIRDLHDLPQIALQAVNAQIDRWSDIRTVMRLREKNGT